MEIWVVGARFVLLIFVILRFVAQGTEKGTAVVLVVLAYVSCVALSHLARRRTVRLPALVIELAVPVAAAFTLEPSFVVLAPLAAAELAHVSFHRVGWAALPAAVPLFFLDLDLLPAYVMAGTMSVGLYVLATRSAQRLAALTSENERLRLAGEELRDRAARDEGYEARLTELAQLEERNRLAHEVHDRVGHAISGSLIQLEAAAAVLESDVGSARRMLRNTAGALREGMDGIRAVLKGSRPATQQIGIHRIRVMLEALARDTTLGTHLTHTGDLGLIGAAQWRVIEDNLRECVTNTLKHANTRTFAVDIAVMNRILRVEAKDDGRGEHTIRKGLGIAGMEERAAKEGGSVIVDGSRGFSVITILPLARQG